MWTRSENGESVQPMGVEISNNGVIVRRNFRVVPEGEDMPAHYEYDEWQMTKEQYEVYQSLEERMHEQDDALVELAGLFAEQDDAIVELAEMIGG